MKPTTFDRINDLNITSEMKTSFMSYAMSVIVSRALPDVRDGLKPVHRRILYGMEGLGVYPNASYKKSARIVGDVMGKYHPHGDSAIYDAMVRMAQEFSYRYPLVDGHGNFGSIDGDGAAAMRYTEAKMTKLSMEMLKDIKKNTIDFADNYDGTEKEPVVLPSKFPNLLVNGSTGIAVGMATNIPPHNLGETIDGIVATIDNPDIDLDGLMQFVKAPDFPTGGIIMGLSGVRKAYETGNGSFKIRSKCDITTKDNGKSVITVHEIPYQVNKTRLIEKIAELAKEKRIEGITDLRDESNRDGIKIIIELRKGVNPEVTLNNLYKFTPMQVSFGVNMLALVNQQPKVLSLKEAIEHYINHQIEVLIRRTEYDLEKAQARAHILEGLLKALDNIDAIIDIIRNAYDDPQEQLMDAFAFTEEQAKAILEMRLRKLSGLEREKIDQELAELRASIEEYEAILASENKQREVIKEDLLALKESHSNDRQSEVSLAHDLELEDEDLIPEEDVMITITQEGYCKRMSADTYKIQNRGGKGMTGIKMHDDDAVEHLLYASTHDYLLFFTNLGRVYKIKGYKIPEFSRASKGLPLVNVLNFETGETLQAITHIKDFESDDYLFFTTKQGVVKRTAVKDYQNIRSSGIRALTLRDDDELHDVKHTDGGKDIILGASNGKAIRFNESTVRPMGRTAAGVRGIQLQSGEIVVGTAVVDETIKEILVVTEKGYGKRTALNEYRLQNRGGKGVKTLNVTKKNGNLVRLAGVSGDEDLIIFSDRGTMIRIPVNQVSCSSRATQGVRLMRLSEGHTVASTAIVPHDEDEKTDLPEEQGEGTCETEDESPVKEASNPNDTEEPQNEKTKASEDDGDDSEDDEEEIAPENLFDFGSSN
ncbi:MAG: DNA gyrase subunit A [Bacillota bacterium]